MRIISFLALPLLILACSNSDESPTIPTVPAEEMYFPPLSNNAWETKSPTDLNWNESEIQPLLDYLELKNTKSFMVLQNGRIVIEQYFNGHTATSPWYWASAGKTLTATVIGIAADEGQLSINNKVSDFLGSGWTSAPLEKENLITVKHLLTMSSGLDHFSHGDCVTPDCLEYNADAGTKWAYHNVYVKLQDVVAEATGQSWNDYFTAKLKNKIGMTGTWIPIDNLSIYWSNTRSMARFGLLALNNGKWESEQIVSTEFMQQATNTSQQMNKSYGYLWWLNGKQSYMLPQSPLVFQGSIIPEAPADMYAALGRDDQKIYVVPSKNLVIIRMGESADGTNFALSDFDSVLWEKISAVIE
ncbi:MAG: serine hydrolase [Flavobacterium sp.]|nr:serine hydrolase [Flavobacterium sp.]